MGDFTRDFGQLEYVGSIQDKQMKPCPFCGTKPEYNCWPSNTSITGYWHEYACQNVNCGTVEITATTKKEAARLWEKRV